MSAAKNCSVNSAISRSTPGAWQTKRWWVIIEVVCGGEGVDFIEHKKYVAGDNWRRIDWNVFARTGQPYVKICYEEKEMLALIVADLSPSMDLGSEKFSKKDVLVEAVATIAFSAAVANMSVGLVGGGGIGGCISSTT